MCCGLILAPIAATIAFIAGVFVGTRQDALLLGASELLSQGGSLLGGASLAGAAHPVLWMAAGMGWVSVLLTTLAVVSSLWIVTALSFASADADLGLLLRGKHGGTAFQGKVVWVTGASQGLGAALAKYLARQGAKVIVSARSADKLKRTRACCPQPDDVLVLPFDLTDSDEQLAAVAKAADEAFGGAGIDFLIHNAGASQHALAAETTGEVAEQLLAINALAPIRLTQAVLPFMLKRHKGRLVVVASMAAKVPAPGQAVYSGAKMAVMGYFSTLATELADQGVGVTLVCPGPVSAPVGEASVRSLYGPSGPITRQEVGDGKRMPASRAVVLIANAMAAGVPECWLARQPVLLLAYLMQYAPSLGLAIMRRVGPSRARALSSGKSGYDMAAFVRGSSGSGSADRRS